MELIKANQAVEGIWIILSNISKGTASSSSGCYKLFNYDLQHLFLFFFLQHNSHYIHFEGKFYNSYKAVS